MDLGEPIPPKFLPFIPGAALSHAPRDDPGNGVAHGLGWFPCPFLKVDACGVDNRIPEVGSDLKVLLTQYWPSIELSVTSTDTNTRPTYF